MILFSARRNRDPMKGFALFKSQKMLKISLEHDGAQVQSVKIHGDFFLYPEGAILTLETALQGVSLDKEKLETAISSNLARNGAEAFGFNAPDLADAILLASKNEVKTG
ncbi:hypothetical protein HY994_01810 [Candidatus Micrarchaeota archaeon]|nr:hypothetical protein [Candidatus Micrarchaeota archaeon]